MVSTLQDFVNQGADLLTSVPFNDHSTKIKPEIEKCFDLLAEKNLSSKVIVLGALSRNLGQTLQTLRTLHKYYTKFEHLWFISDGEFLTVLPAGTTRLKLAKCQFGRCCFSSNQPTE